MSIYVISACWIPTTILQHPYSSVVSLLCMTSYCLARNCDSDVYLCSAMAISIIKILISSSPYIAAAFIYNRRGIAPLQIETGRYISLLVEERICRSCNTGQVEDKQYFCVGFPALEEACRCTFGSFAVMYR